MAEEEKTRPDGGRPATLHNGAVSTDFPTLRDAIIAWNRLRPEPGAESFHKNNWRAALRSSRNTEASQWAEVARRLRLSLTNCELVR